MYLCAFDLLDTVVVGLVELGLNLVLEPAIETENHVVKKHRALTVLPDFHSHQHQQRMSSFKKLHFVRTSQRQQRRVGRGDLQGHSRAQRLFQVNEEHRQVPLVKLIFIYTWRS